MLNTVKKTTAKAQIGGNRQNFLKQMKQILSKFLYSLKQTKNRNQSR